MAEPPQGQQQLLESLLDTAEKLASQRPTCHKTNSDLAGLILITKMHSKGFDVSLADAEGCVKRMRIAVESGQYPDHLLNEAPPLTGRICPGT